MRHPQLKAFHHVALLGGFSRAAEALHLTQPAVSEQVRKLEQDHDVLLFHRVKKRVFLTSEGEQLLQFTKRYFEVEKQIEDYLSESSAATEGELRIVADSAQHMADVLAPFQKRYPNITISLRAGNTGEIIEELRSYNAEIGVVGSLSPGKDMSVLNLGSTEIVAFASHGLLKSTQKSLTFEELSKLPLIFREQGSKTRENVELAARAQGTILRPAIVAEGREAVRELVASGAGIGFVSQAEFGHDRRLVQFALQDACLLMSESIVFLTQRRDVKVIRAFMDFAAGVQATKAPPAGRPPEGE